MFRISDRRTVSSEWNVDADPDLEGSFGGFTVDGSDSWVEFTVTEHALTRVRCSDAVNKVVEIALSEPVVNGKVEFVGDTGRFSAWVASASEAAGMIDMAPCTGGLHWEASLGGHLDY